MGQGNKIIIANWKMNLDVQDSVKLAEDIRDLAEGIKNKEIVVCPSFLAVYEVANVLKNSNVFLGAQDAFYEEEGAYTGEVSAEDLKSLGCKYVILGHSERRALGETDEVVNKKVKAVLVEGLTPIVCVGETLSERRAGNTEPVLAHQVSRALEGVSGAIIVAYEPVWAISTSGSGQTITSQEAAKQIKAIKANIPDEIQDYKILYGGSVNDETVANFTEDFAGALVGSASLKAKVFVNLIKNA